MAHFSGHAILDPKTGQPSFPLTPESSGTDATSMLSAETLRNMHCPNLKLVVLSACGTLSAGQPRSSGAFGLAQALHRAGSQNVIGTLWPIGDAVSQQFAIQLHQRLKATGDPVRALRETQLSLLAKDSSLQASSSWAGFVISTRLERP
jgi:CHAT domain-containing protein